LGRAKLVVVTHVDPDRRVVRRTIPREPEQVVSRKVRVVVECERSVGRAAREDGRRMASDRAESLRLDPPEVERAEAAHRDAADRDAVPVSPGTRERRRDRLVQHV
jgi:hypothetical protein